jgi:hypothetical protein
VVRQAQGRGGRAGSGRITEHRGQSYGAESAGQATEHAPPIESGGFRVAINISPGCQSVVHHINLSFNL